VVYTSRNSILVIACTHIPFEHRHFLDFALEIYQRVKCDRVIHLGDLVDNHAISYHEHDPDGKSPADEMAEADKHLKKWFKVFPNLELCLGNHDRMADRKSKTVGLPSRVFKSFRDIWQLPSRWETAYSFEHYGVRFQHGTGYSGDNANIKAASYNRQSTAIGHIHHICTMGYTASEKDCIFGMAVGCGIDRNKYAFAYEKDFPRKPLLGCGVVTDNGEFAQVFKMKI
jgi:predicted phosphodiesterase